jgi:hypothetical protein
LSNSSNNSDDGSGGVGGKKRKHAGGKGAPCAAWRAVFSAPLDPFDALLLFHKVVLPSHRNTFTPALVVSNVVLVI